jgi:uncharacterized membrane protein YgcG
MTGLRLLLLAALAFLLAPAIAAEESITRFDVTIEVQKNADVIVTERIAVVAEGVEIRRGIFRDLPLYYESDGARLPYRYSVLEVMRDGQREPYETETDGNAFRIRIGREDVFLDRGPHQYEIRYRVRNQVRYFDDHDEIYWNATGNYWVFPIRAARASVVLPPGADVLETVAYTGSLGGRGSDYSYSDRGDTHVFETTRPMAPREGLTVSVSIAKGAIDPPSAADEAWLWWQRHGSLTILGGSFLALLWFFLRSFDRVGRDPPKGPVFPLYEPPRGYSPAAVHHIYYRGLRQHQALIATLMNLAVKGRMEIDTTDSKVTELTATPGKGASGAGFTAEDAALERSIFLGQTRKSIGAKYDASFTGAYSAFRKALSNKYGAAYFRWNAFYTILGLVLTAVGMAAAIKMATMWTPWHTAGVLGLAGLNLSFLYLMPAPTPKGQQVRTEIEGFRLYLETAEKLQLNAVEVGGKAPPPMSKERYEMFLPYAVALGVERPWTRHFERLLPKEAEGYRPGWTHFSSSGGRSLSSLNSALVASMATGVSSALPQSSSSSGGGGGGSSGGGGGGGGGGGW